MFAKLFSAILSVLCLFQTLMPAFLGAKNEASMDNEAFYEVSSVSEYMEYIREYGAPSFDTETFIKALRPVKLLRTFVIGQLFADEEDKYLRVQMSEELQEVCGYLRDNTGFDMFNLLQHIPKTLGVLTALKRGVHPDFTAFRHKVYDLSDELRQDGQTTFATLLYLFGMFFTIVEDMNVYTVPGEKESELVVMMDVTFDDGTTETVDPDIVIDTETMKAYAYPGYGAIGSGFDLDLNELTLYTVLNAWQRKFGFCLGYDLHAAHDPIFNYETRRFKFDYAGKEWMIQIWKGNYALSTNGGELGVYNRDAKKIGTYYDAASDEDMLVMSMTVLHGDELIVERGPERHWWVTGFKMMKVIYLPETLTMKFSVEMKDEEMLAAFLRAIETEAHHDVLCSADGLTVNGVW